METTDCNDANAKPDHDKAKHTEHNKEQNDESKDTIQTLCENQQSLNNLPFDCKECLLSFDFIEDLEKHVGNSHNNTERQKSDYVLDIKSESINKCENDKLEDSISAEGDQPVPEGEANEGPVLPKTVMDTLDFETEDSKPNIISLNDESQNMQSICFVCGHLDQSPEAINQHYLIQHKEHSSNIGNEVSNVAKHNKTKHGNEPKDNENDSDMEIDESVVEVSSDISVVEKVNKNVSEESSLNNGNVETTTRKENESNDKKKPSDTVNKASKSRSGPRSRNTVEKHQNNVPKTEIDTEPKNLKSTQAKNSLLNPSKGKQKRIRQTQNLDKHDEALMKAFGIIQSKVCLNRMDNKNDNMDSVGNDETNIEPEEEIADLTAVRRRRNDSKVDDDKIMSNIEPNEDIAELKTTRRSRKDPKAEDDKSESNIEPEEGLADFKTVRRSRTDPKVNEVKTESNNEPNEDKAEHKTTKRKRTGLKTNVMNDGKSELAAAVTISVKQRNTRRSRSGLRMNLIDDDNNEPVDKPDTSVKPTKQSLTRKSRSGLEMNDYRYNDESVVQPDVGPTDNKPTTVLSATRKGRSGLKRKNNTDNNNVGSTGIENVDKLEDSNGKNVESSRNTSMEVSPSKRARAKRTQNLLPESPKIKPESSPCKSDSELLKDFGIKETSISLVASPIKLNVSKRPGPRCKTMGMQGALKLAPLPLNPKPAPVKVDEMSEDEMQAMLRACGMGISVPVSASTNVLAEIDDTSEIDGNNSSNGKRKSQSPEPSTSHGHMRLKRSRTARKSTNDNALFNRYNLKDSKVILKNLSRIDISLLRNPNSPFGKTDWLKHKFDSDTDSDLDWDIPTPPMIEEFIENTEKDSKMEMNVSAKSGKSSTQRDSDSLMLKKFGIDDSVVIIDSPKKGIGSAVKTPTGNLHSDPKSTSHTNLCSTSNDKKQISDADLLKKFGISDAKVMLSFDNGPTVGEKSKSSTTGKITSADLKSALDEALKNISDKEKLKDDMEKTVSIPESQVKIVEPVSQELNTGTNQKRNTRFRKRKIGKATSVNEAVKLKNESDSDFKDSLKKNSNKQSTCLKSTNAQDHVKRIRGKPLNSARKVKSSQRVSLASRTMPSRTSKSEQDFTEGVQKENDVSMNVELKSEESKTHETVELNNSSKNSRRGMKRRAKPSAVKSDTQSILPVLVKSLPIVQVKIPVLSADEIMKLTKRYQNGKSKDGKGDGTNIVDETQSSDEIVKGVLNEILDCICCSETILDSLDEKEAEINKNVVEDTNENVFSRVDSDLTNDTLPNTSDSEPKPKVSMEKTNDSKQKLKVSIAKTNDRELKSNKSDRKSKLKSPGKKSKPKTSDNKEKRLLEELTDRSEGERPNEDCILDEAQAIDKPNEEEKCLKAMDSSDNKATEAENVIEDANEIESNIVNPDLTNDITPKTSANEPKPKVADKKSMAKSNDREHTMSKTSDRISKSPGKKSKAKTSNRKEKCLIQEPEPDGQKLEDCMPEEGKAIDERNEEEKCLKAMDSFDNKEAEAENVTEDTNENVCNQVDTDLTNDTTPKTFDRKSKSKSPGKKSMAKTNDNESKSKSPGKKSIAKTSDRKEKRLLEGLTDISGDEPNDGKEEKCLNIMDSLDNKKVENVIEGTNENVCKKIDTHLTNDSTPKTCDSEPNPKVSDKKSTRKTNDREPTMSKTSDRISKSTSPVKKSLAKTNDNESKSKSPGKKSKAKTSDRKEISLLKELTDRSGSVPDEIPNEDNKAAYISTKDDVNVSRSTNESELSLNSESNLEEDNKSVDEINKPNEEEKCQKAVNLMDVKNMVSVDSSNLNETLNDDNQTSNTSAKDDLNVSGSSLESDLSLISESVLKEDNKSADEGLDTSQDENEDTKNALTDLDQDPVPLSKSVFFSERNDDNLEETESKTTDNIDNELEHSQDSGYEPKDEESGSHNKLETLKEGINSDKNVQDKPDSDERKSKKSEPMFEVKGKDSEIESLFGRQILGKTVEIMDKNTETVIGEWYDIEENEDNELKDAENVKQIVNEKPSVKTNPSATNNDSFERIDTLCENCE